MFLKTREKMGNHDDIQMKIDFFDNIFLFFRHLCSFYSGFLSKNEEILIFEQKIIFFQFHYSYYFFIKFKFMTNHRVYLNHYFLKHLQPIIKTNLDSRDSLLKSRPTMWLNVRSLAISRQFTLPSNIFFIRLIARHLSDLVSMIFMCMAGLVAKQCQLLRIQMHRKYKCMIC